MFFIPPCMRTPLFICNESLFNTCIFNQNKLPYYLPRADTPECEGVKEQPDSVKYYFLNYCYTNKCKCLICFKPLPPFGSVPIPEGLPPADKWYNIKNLTGNQNSFTITIESMLLPITVPSDKILAVKISYAPLKLYFSNARGDYFTTATAQGDKDAVAAKYMPVRIEGFVFPYPATGTVPLKLYWSSARGDNFTTATTQGERDALAAGYKFVRVEGYIYPNHIAGTVPLKLYWSSVRGDNFTTATSQGEKDALAAGYKFVRIEGYVFPF